jgi:5'-nucleotidase
MAEAKTKILLTNDDGIDAPGIRALRDALKDSHDVLVVAPMYEKSGAGCSLSLSSEMEVDTRKDESGAIWGYAVNGTPADCVKFAMRTRSDFRPDIVLSGMNRGMNIGNSIFYSGTVAGAIEATLYGFKAVACSIQWLGREVVHFEDACSVVRDLVPWFVEQPLQPRTLWNINFPNVKLKEMGEVRITSHGTSFFEDEFELYRRDGEKLFYRNIGSKMVACALKDDADDRAVMKGDISLSLLKLDLTTPIPQETVSSLKAHLKKPRKTARQ